MSAFDDCFVYRYTKDRTAKEKINVRYINGPKNRVLHDIIDKAKTLTLPVVTVEQTGISRDSTRNQNKNQFMYRPSTGNPSNSVARIPMPVPVNLPLNVSIMTEFKEDLDQIVGNFIPFCNPYFVVSWKIPPEYGMDFIDELRIEIEWDGNITYETPNSLNPADKARIIGSTSFIIKGWLFPNDFVPQAPIYTVKANFYSVDLKSYDDYLNLSGFPYETDTILISAFPEVTNFFSSNLGTIIPITDQWNIEKENVNNFILYGKRFNYNNVFYLSSNTPNFYNNFEEIVTAKYPTISAYRLPQEFVSVINDNIVNFSLSANSLNPGNFTIVTMNSAGWVSTGSLITVS